MSTKKVKSAGRFKERYGLKIRSRVAKIEKYSRARHECPKCMKKTLKREAAGIWTCKNCKMKLAGGAYQPDTATGKIVRQLKGGKIEDVRKHLLEGLEEKKEAAEKKAEA